jgi:hypothetical protein
MWRALPRPGRPSRRARRVALAGSLGTALVLAAGLVWQSANASFTVTTYPFTPSWTTGTVVIGDDDAGSALFTRTGLKPGAAGTRCLTVTSTGNVPALVRLYVTGRTTTKSLSGSINLSVLAGTGGGNASCSGFTPDSTVYTGTLAAFPTTFGTGVGSWTTAGVAGETRTFQITYSVPSTAPTSVQTGTASAAFTWEAQST